MLLMRQPLSIGSVLGNRTPDSAVRGLRLNLLTNTPYSLIIYAVQRKINYTEELPSCPVLFLFFSKLFWAPDGYGGVGRPIFSPFLAKPYVFVPGSKFFTQFPAGIRGSAGDRAGRFARFRRLPGRPVCSPLPAKPYAFVSGSKFFTQLPAGKRNFAGSRPGRFVPRSPRSLMPSFRGANSSHNFRPENAVSPAAGPADLLPAPREALSLRFGEQILQTTPGRKARFCRRPARPICSPLPAKPYPFVSGSKFFTQLPVGKRNFAGSRPGRFAPPSPLSLTPSFRGANSSHNFRPKSAISPASGTPAFFVPVFLVLDRKKQCATFLATSHTASL